MFHNSTTIWHKPTANLSPFKEKRMAFGVWGTLKGLANQAMVGVQKAGYYGKRGLKSWPVKYTMYPFSAAWKKTGQAGKWAYDKATWGGNYVKQAGLGVVDTRDSVARGLFDVAYAPIDSMKHSLVYNTRDIIKGVFKTPYELAKGAIGGTWNFTKKLFKAPYNLVRHPIKSLVKAKDSVKKMVSSVRSKVGKTIDNLLSFKIGALAKSTRDSVAGVLKFPFKALKKPYEIISETPKKVYTNIKNAVWAYPQGVGNFFKGMRDGFGRILNAHNTTSGLMAERKLQTQKDLAAIESSAAA